MSNVKKHLNSLTLPQLRALAIQRKVLTGPVVTVATKSELVAVLRDVPDVLRPVVA